MDTGECAGGLVSEQAVVAKSPLFIDVKYKIRAYGEISIRHNAADLAQKQCHVIYKLFVSHRGRSFAEVKRFSWEAGEGQISGIDIVGVSPNGSELAADFLWAEGDGEVHRPVVYNVLTNKVFYRSLDNQIQRLIHGCDQNEDFIGVTNDGKAIFAVPPSDYDDTPECGDKGTWYFDLQTGEVRQVAKFSGVKWE